MHVLIYSCSSGELKALNMAGVEDAMTFKASQDRYAVMLDSSFQQVVLEAVGTEYLARKIRVHPGKMTKSSAQSPNSANALVELHSLKIPRVVDVEVKGLCPSLNSTKYSIRFAPNQLLPQKLLIASEDNTFQRCIAFSTLAGSRLSIPSNVSKVKAVADLDFSLGMEASWQNLPLLSQAVVLRRGRPQVADVLVNITGHTQQNGTADIPASGKLLENGNIVLVVSKYDMTEMKSLQMIIVPILPDENFKVRWLNEKAENMDIPAEDLPIFKHCLESEVLLQRYRACKNAGGTGDWNTSILNRTIAPDFQGVEIHFVVELHSASPSDSYLGWGKRRSHRITAEFVGVDAPLAWAAKQHGCHLLDNERALLRSTLHTNEAHSADGLCEILHCNKSTNASQPTPLCAGYHDRYGPLRLNEAFQSTSNVMKLMSCIDKFCDARLEETSVGWTYHHGSLTTTHPGWDDVNQKEYQKTWRLADLFEAALDLDNDLFANALDVLSGIARHAANETYLADNKTRDGKQQSLATDWLRHAIETRSLPLLQAVSSALPQGFLNTEEFVGETAYVRAQEAEGHDRAEIPVLHHGGLQRPIGTSVHWVPETDIDEEEEEDQVEVIEPPPLTSLQTEASRPSSRVALCLIPQVLHHRVRGWLNTFPLLFLIQAVRCTLWQDQDLVLVQQFPKLSGRVLAFDWFQVLDVDRESHTTTNPIQCGGRIPEGHIQALIELKQYNECRAPVDLVICSCIEYSESKLSSIRRSFPSFV
eukprot:Skav207674  [mRNA]  locus=scaffold1857:338093:346141:- [translate_table: standard]